MPDAKVLQIPKGSVIVLTGVDPPAHPDTGDFDVAVVDALKSGVARACGHEEFAFLFVSGDGDVHVADADEILALLERATS